MALQATIRDTRFDTYLGFAESLGIVTYVTDERQKRIYGFGMGYFYTIGGSRYHNAR